MRANFLFCGQSFDKDAEYPMGDSLAVELAALTRAALVRIQVPQPLDEHP